VFQGVPKHVPERRSGTFTTDVSTFFEFFDPPPPLSAFASFAGIPPLSHLTSALAQPPSPHQDRKVTSNFGEFLHATNEEIYAKKNTENTSWSLA